MDIYIYGQVEGGTQYPIEVASGLQRKETSSPIGSEFTALLGNYDRPRTDRQTHREVSLPKRVEIKIGKLGQLCVQTQQYKQIIKIKFQF